MDNSPINWAEKEVALQDLKFTPDNPRRITGLSFDRLKDKIKRFGYHSRIKVQPDLTIIGGNMRLRALTELNVLRVMVLVPDRALTPDEYKQLVVQDNLLDGEWDMDVLGANYEIAELENMGFPEKLLEYPEEKTPEDKLSDDADHFDAFLNFCPHCGHSLPSSK